MNTEWLIWSNEHGAWWGPDCNGYVKSMDDAGRYPLNIAERICKNANCALGRTGVPMETMMPASCLPEPITPEIISWQPTNCRICGRPAPRGVMWTACDECQRILATEGK